MNINPQRNYQNIFQGMQSDALKSKLYGMGAQPKKPSLPAINPKLHAPFCGLMSGMHYLEGAVPAKLFDFLAGKLLNKHPGLASKLHVFNTVRAANMFDRCMVAMHAASRK